MKNEKARPGRVSCVKRINFLLIERVVMLCMAGSAVNRTCGGEQRRPVKEGGEQKFKQKAAVQQNPNSELAEMCNAMCRLRLSTVAPDRGSPRIPINWPR